MTAGPALPVIGWVVLTEQRDGTWLPDWDGHLHATKATALAELDEAAARSDITCQVAVAEVRGVLP